MQYVHNYQKELDKSLALILAALFFVLFIWHESVLFSRLLAEEYISDSSICLEKARTLPKSQLIEKSLLYQKALRLLSNSIKQNSYDSNAYFKYGETIREIADDSELRNAIDIQSVGAQKKVSTGYYDAARVKYTEAILRELTNGIYHQRLGDTYAKLSDDEKAEKEFKNTVLLDPQNRTIYFYLSQYFWSKGKYDDFMYNVHKVIEFDKIQHRGRIGYALSSFLKSIKREDLIPK